jgi:hypothetical protein
MNLNNDVSDWETFEQELKKLRAKYDKPPLRLLFRGQANSDWSLDTTLERSGQSGMTFTDFYQLISRVGPAVETFTGMSVPEYSQAVQDLFTDDELLSLRRFPPVDLYRYMVYLRHHGFPSPLLDWSLSPYVAAFFAFRDPIESAEKRSIYVYCEMPESSKGGIVGGPTIQPLGSYVRSHRRHFTQQSNYTICGSFDTKSSQWHFHAHEDVFANPYPGQDFRWKFNLPSSERGKVLRLLDEYNLNAFSLFDSEETLLETMWFREHVLKADECHESRN